MEGIPSDINAFAELTASPNGNMYVIGEQIFFRLPPGQDVWTEIDIPDMSFLSQVSVNPEGQIYVCHRNSGLYRAETDTSDFEKILDGLSSVNELRTFGNDLNFVLSGFGLSDKMIKFSDDGNNTQVLDPLSFGAGFYNDLDLLTDGTLLLSEWGGIHISEDEGETWEKREIHSSFGTVNVYSTHVQPSGDIFYLNDFGVWHTEDVNEPAVALTEPPFDIFQNPFTISEFAVMDFAEPGYIYFAQRNQFFFYSDDNGQNWGHADSKFKEPNVTKILKDSEGNLFAQTEKTEAVEMSSDDGETWETLKVPDEKIKDFAVHENGDLFVLIQETLFFTSVKRSSNKGETWTDLQVNVSVSASFSEIAVTGDGTVWLKHEDGLIFSEDLGANWEKLGFPQVALYFPPAVHPNGNIYLNTLVGSFLSEDDGETWTHIVPQYDILEPPYISQSGKVYLIAFDASEPETVVLVSDEVGNNFTPLPFLPDQLITFFQLKILADCDENLILTDLTRILLSLDSGNSWINLGFGIQDGAIINDIYLDESNFLYLGLSNDVIQRSKEPTCDFTNIESPEEKDLNIRIYPNPMSDFAVINIENQRESEYSIKIFDVTGKELRTEKISSNQHKFQRENLNSGLYFYQIESKNQMLKTGKLIIR